MSSLLSPKAPRGPSFLRAAAGAGVANSHSITSPRARAGGGVSPGGHAAAAAPPVHPSEVIAASILTFTKINQSRSNSLWVGLNEFSSQGWPPPSKEDLWRMYATFGLIKDVAVNVDVSARCESHRSPTSNAFICFETPEALQRAHDAICLRNCPFGSLVAYHQAPNRLPRASEPRLYVAPALSITPADEKEGWVWCSSFFESIAVLACCTQCWPVCTQCWPVCRSHGR